MRTSYKKNRPFDFKLIDLVEPNPVLYKRSGLSNYDAMKAKTDIWARIAEMMGCDVDFCLMRWNNLHYQFRKEIRRADTSGSTWPYLERLRFLGESQPPAKTKCKQKVRDSSGKQEDSVEQETPVHFLWETYEDGEVTQQPSTFLIEEIIEEPSEQIIQEEIIYEEQETAQILSPKSSFLQMDQVLAQLKEPQRNRAERRITAFLLKCQLCALSNQSTSDLVI
ncbi:transcription factor Adf-1 [Drosophila elegans]|uniref:transcription factor Adf-1 n=1 Tax=Drosophila elegans TaxID=30023 RepID=UPI0007E5BFCF|nr:transcription factor Adf-1 [Drosophila elegans]XP_017121788.1 transcription factor Adf-1 [Drosophila elegans]